MRTGIVVFSGTVKEFLEAVESMPIDAMPRFETTPLRAQPKPDSAKPKYRR